MEEKREGGYYWVNYRGEVQIAEWIPIEKPVVGFWLLCGNEESLQDKHMEAINETRITPPEQKCENDNGFTDHN